MNLKFDKSWSVFLDRDGVINKERRADYVKNIDEFIFEEGALAALKKLNEIFGVIVIVTNQRGVGSGIMSAEDLHSVHDHMLEAIHSNGGRIVKIYFAPDEDRNSTNRKPHPTMGHQAKNDFPEIDFSKSILIGNTISDMAFGRNIGAYTVFLPTTRPDVALDDARIDQVSNSLLDFAGLLSK